MLLQNAACYNLGEPDENVTGMEAVSTGSINMNSGAPAAPMGYGRNMTFPRQSASYALRHELPAIVTEGENYRLPGEVFIVTLINSRLYLCCISASQLKMQ